MSDYFSEDKIEKVMSGTLRLQTEFDLFPGKVGTGILCNNKGHVLTNAHVVFVSLPGKGTSAPRRWDASKVLVSFKGGAQYYARICHWDHDNDLALLQIDEIAIGPSNFPCDFSKVVPGIGDKFFVVGHPNGSIIPVSAKDGRVSDPSRSPSDIPVNILKDHFSHSPDMDPSMTFVELDVMAGPGFSGGPLSVDGSVFGVLHAGIPKTAVCYGIPFAIIERHLGRMIEESNALDLAFSTEHPSAINLPEDAGFNGEDSTI